MNFWLNKHEFEHRTNIELYALYKSPIFICNFCKRVVGLKENEIKKLSINLAKCPHKDANKIKISEIIFNRINCFKKREI